MRPSGRAPDQLRETSITRNFTRHAEGSVLICFGETRVLCNASVEDKVPPFMRGEGRGWVTAEYSMLPRATHTRSTREAARGKLGGRTMEIQRLIGRALRAVVDFELLGERTIVVDCDVLQADGGTRTAAITGSWLALADAVDKLLAEKVLDKSVAEYLASNPALNMTLEGHADERGSREYNIGLGERRANAVRTFLEAEGVSTSQINTISYGEERPMAMGHDEVSWAENRRGVLVY